MNRSLYRSATDKKIAGVCGGLAAWLGMNNTLVRVVWVILTLAGQFFWGVALYGVLAVVLPIDAEVIDYGNNTGSQSGFHFDGGKAPFFVGAALLALGGWMLLSRLVPNIGRFLTPILFITVGLVLVLGWQRRKD